MEQIRKLVDEIEACPKTLEGTLTAKIKLIALLNLIAAKLAER